MAYHPQQLSDVFQALADPTRRSVLARLASGPASVSDLAAPYAMALPSFMKHIHLLEESGLIRTHKHGRVRTCAVEKQSLAMIETWLSEQRALWEGRTDRLEQYVIASEERERLP